MWSNKYYRRNLIRTVTTEKTKSYNKRKREETSFWSIKLIPLQIQAFGRYYKSTKDLR